MNIHGNRYNKTALSENALTITGRRLDGAKMPSRLQISTSGNNIQLTAWTGLEDKARSRVAANLNQFAAVGFFEKLKEIASNKDGGAESTSIKNFTGRGSDRREAGRLEFGRNKHGVMFISLTDANDFQIVFSLISDYYHQLINVETGEPVTKQEASRYYTNGICSTFLRLIPAVLAGSLYDFKQDKVAQEQWGNKNKNGSNGGYGGGSNNGYSGGSNNGASGGSQKNSEHGFDFDDDIPM